MLEAVRRIVSRIMPSGMGMERLYLMWVLIGPLGLFSLWFMGMLELKTIVVGVFFAVFGLLTVAAFSPATSVEKKSDTPAIKSTPRNFADLWQKFVAVLKRYEREWTILLQVALVLISLGAVAALFTWFNYVTSGDRGGTFGVTAMIAGVGIVFVWIYATFFEGKGK